MNYWTISANLECLKLDFLSNNTIKSLVAHLNLKEEVVYRNYQGFLNGFKLLVV